MPFKFDSNGTIATVGEGDKRLPVFVYPDGREAPFDADSTLGTITRLNGEAKTHREAKEAAEAEANAFKTHGLTAAEAEAARKALDTVKNIKDGDLLTAGKVEEIKAAARKAAEDQVAAAHAAHVNELNATKEREKKLEQQLYAEKIGGGFSRSKFIAEKVAIPPDMVQARFGSSFKVEEGKIVAYDPAGNKLFSSTRPGEVADFDEALEALVQQYPYKDQILKGSGATGGGATGGGANLNGSGQDLSKLSPVARLTEARKRGIT